jgi:hypothetical protein
MDLLSASNVDLELTRICNEQSSASIKDRESRHEIGI